MTEGARPNTAGRPGSALPDGAPERDQPERDQHEHEHRIGATVDLHCHILPGIDDGARDMEDAVAMACQAEADGIWAICATPHIRHDHDVRIAELHNRRAELNDAIRAAGCSTRVLAGAEVAATAADGLDDAELLAVALGDGHRWILLEPAPGPLDDGLDAVVHGLHERGYRALIAHPERHPAGDLIPRLAGLIAEGALVQVTADYLVQQNTREGMLALARAGVVHVLASDSHSSRGGRPVAISPALGVLGSVIPPAQLDWIAYTAPEAIAGGAALTLPFQLP